MVGISILTNILPRWGNAYIPWRSLHCYIDFTPLGDAYTYKTACYKDHTTPTESDSVVGFVLLQIYYPAGVMIG